MTGQLDPDSRRVALADLTSTDLDVLVVGGGLVGAGTALDAVSRGLRVGLVERADWGAEASGHSSTVVGGSWGDVTTFDPVRLRTALRERGRLMEWLAPHVVHRVPFLYPLEQGPRQRVAVGAEVLSYDGIARSLPLGRLLPAHRHLSRRVVRRITPALRTDAATGGVQFYDAHADDARLTVTVVRTASAYGAAVASRAELTALILDDDRVRGVHVRDRETGQDLTITARVVVLAAGLRTQALLRASGSPLPEGPQLEGGLIKRSFVVLPRSAIRSSTGLVLATSAGLIRAVPRGRHWLIGPRRTPVTADLAADADDWPTAGAVDIKDLLDSVNQHLGTELHRAQVEGCYAGWVPAGEPRRRLAPAWSPRPGLVVAGQARLTTYRLVSAQTVDVVAAELGGLVAPSVTLRLPLLGADGYQARWNQRHLSARRAGLHVARVEHLLNRYGSAAGDLLQLVSARPELRQALPGAEDYLQAEVVYAVTHEGARTLIDILARRTRVAIGTADGGQAAARPAAQLAAAELGWTETEQTRQIDDYLAWISRERQGLTAEVPVEL